MSNYPCSKFDCGATFEQWCNDQEHENKELLDEISQDNIDEWNGKGDSIRIVNGELQLLDKAGNKKSGVNLCLSDSITLERDSVSGKMCVIGIKEKNSARVINLWVGSKELYDKTQTVPNPNYLYWITDMSMSEIIGAITNLRSRVTQAEADIGLLAGRASSLEARCEVLNSNIVSLTNTFTPTHQLVSSLEITRDENGVIKFGDMIVPQKLLLSNTDHNIPRTESVIKSAAGFEFVAGGLYEISLYAMGRRSVVKTNGVSFGSGKIVCDFSFAVNDGEYGINLFIGDISTKSGSCYARFKAYNISVDGKLTVNTASTIGVKEIYKVIE